MQSNDLNILLRSHEETKRIINAYKNQLDEINQKIIQHVGVKTEGATTEKTQWYKVTTTGRVNRKTDQDPQRMAALQATIGTEAFLNTFTIEYKLQVGAFKQLQKFDNESYIAIADLVTETPGKPAVLVERVVEDE